MCTPASVRARPIAAEHTQARSGGHFVLDALADATPLPGYSGTIGITSRKRNPVALDLFRERLRPTNVPLTAYGETDMSHGYTRLHTLSSIRVYLGPSVANDFRPFSAACRVSARMNGRAKSAGMTSRIGLQGRTRDL